MSKKLEVEVSICEKCPSNHASALDPEWFYCWSLNMRGLRHEELIDGIHPKCPLEEKEPS